MMMNETTYTDAGGTPVPAHLKSVQSLTLLLRVWAHEERVAEPNDSIHEAEAPVGKKQYNSSACRTKAQKGIDPPRSAALFIVSVRVY